MGKFIEHLKKIKIMFDDFRNYKDFKKFWSKLDKSKINNEELIFFIDNYVKSESYNFTSRFWSTRNVKHLSLLLNSEKDDELDYEISSDYFTWLESSNSRIKTLIDNLNDQVFDEKFTLAKKQKFITHHKSLQHNVILMLLYKHLKLNDKKNYFDILKNKKSFTENNPFIEIENNKVSQDLVNSIIELYEIEKNLNIFKKDIKMSFFEVGAGNGRMADAITNIYNNSNYVICDIPIASYICYKRFKKNYPNKKVVCVYNLNTTEEIMNSIKVNDIIFILPHQIELIEEKYFDIVIALDCIHEMNKKTVKFYMKNIDKISKFFFMKVWENTDVPYEFNRNLNIHDNSYEFLSKWKLIKKEKSIFPSSFYNITFDLD